MWRGVVATLIVGCSSSAPRSTPRPAAAPTDSELVCWKPDPAAPQPTTHFDAVSAALVRKRPEIKECIRKADPIVRDLQYVLTVKLVGRQSGTEISGVELTRIAGVRDHRPIEVKTSAESCVTALLTPLVLPPSSGPSEMMTIMRYDDCTPKVIIAKAFVRAYARELASNSAQPCPGRIDKLDPWGRPYQVICGTGVMSLGRDGRAGTADDVESWDENGITRERPARAESSDESAR